MVIPTVDRRRAHDLSKRFPGWIVAAGLPIAHRWRTWLVADSWDALEAQIAAENSPPPHWRLRGGLSKDSRAGGFSGSRPLRGPCAPPPDVPRVAGRTVFIFRQRVHQESENRVGISQLGIATLPRLLAVEVLLAEPEALQDDVLESCLYILRDRLRGTEREDKNHQSLR
jgi:hypothetical protein